MAAVRTRVLLTVVAAAVLALAAAPPGAAAKRDIRPYAGLGTWIDIYDKSAFNRPVEHGVGDRD